MGTFKIEIVAVGGHGVDRSKKNGEQVNFEEGGSNTPDALAYNFLKQLQEKGIYFGFTDSKATITHWPGSEHEVVDDLITGIRKGNF